MSTLSLSLLGPFQALLDKRPFPKFRTSRVKALLIYLVLETAQRHQRDALMALLWPEMSQEAAQINLRQTLYQLRKIIPELNEHSGGGTSPFLLVERKTVGVNTAVSFHLDVTAFTGLLDAVATHTHSDPLTCPPCQAKLKQAVTLYRGDFLADFYLPDSAAFADWALSWQEMLRRRMLAALDTLTLSGIRQGAYAEAEKAVHRQLEIDNLRETAHRQLMEILARSGDRSAALAHYQICRQILQNELGAAPSAQTQALYEAIYAGELDQVLTFPHKEPPQHSPHHNLPAQPTPFIGRETELAALTDLISTPAVRLITIVGSGGMGKTRLALAFAEKLLPSAPHFANGIFFVPLAGLSSVEHIPPALAEAVELPLQSSSRTPTQQLLDYLRRKQMLIVMDNFEHLLDGAEFVAKILQAAPAVKIVATSRERLRLQGEQLYHIQGLDFPDWETPADAERYTAVQLFLQSARRVDPEFVLRKNDLTYLTRICRLAAGMPLAIELAAAWVDMLSLADIAAEIKQNIDFLETDVRNVPQRHRSMRAVFDTSWQRLSTSEQTLFAQLAIFRGGFTKEAARETTGASLRLIAGLANKSLLQYDKTKDRYQIHELLRQFGEEKPAAQTPTDQTPTVSEMRHRHAGYYSQLLHTLETDLKGDRQQAAMADIRADMDNVRFAWNWALTQRHALHIEQAIYSLGCYYWWHGPFFEGAIVMGGVVQKFTKSSDQPRLLAKALTWQGHLLRISGDVKTAATLIQRSLALLDSPALSEEDTRSEKAFALWAMVGCIPFGPNRMEKMRRVLEQSHEYYQSLNDQWGIAHTLWFLAELAPDLDTERKLAEQSLSIQQSIGDQRGMAFSLGALAGIAESQGRFEESEHLRKKYNAIFQKIGDRVNYVLSYGGLASSLALQGKFDQAQIKVKKCVDSLDDLDIRGYLYSVVSRHLGNIKNHLGQFDQAHNLAQQILTMSQEANNQRMIGLSQWLMGEVALAKGAYEEAYQLLEKAVSNVDNQERRAIILAESAYAALGLNKIGKARQYLISSLQITLDIHSLSPFYYVLPAIALWFAKQNAKDRAITLFALAECQPYIAKSRWFEAVAGQKLAKVAEMLPPDAVQAAQEKGRALNLWESASDMLAELTGASKNEVVKEITSPVGITHKKIDPEKRFNLGEQLAAGGHGTVHFGIDTMTNQQIVIKKLKPELVWQNPKIIHRFIQEGELLRQLNHPNIVKMLDAFEQDGEYSIVMEYVPGGDLRDLLKRRPELDITQVLMIGLELADALARAHHLNIIHRDLKPANVLIAADGTPRLTDFGIARLTTQETRLTQEGSFMGSPAYMSPEACTGEELDARSDIWSFGVILYEMLTGHNPFAREQITATLISILNEPLPDLKQFRPDVPSTLTALIGQMLTREREHRIAGMRKIAAELESI